MRHCKYGPLKKKFQGTGRIGLHNLRVTCQWLYIYATEPRCEHRVSSSPNVTLAFLT